MTKANEKRLLIFIVLVWRSYTVTVGFAFVALSIPRFRFEKSVLPSELAAHASVIECDFHELILSRSCLFICFLRHQTVKNVETTKKEALN